MSDSDGEEKLEYKIDDVSSSVDGYLMQADENHHFHTINLSGKLLKGQKITVTPIGDGKCRVEAECEGKLDPEKLVALVAFNTRVKEKKYRQSENEISNNDTIPDVVFREKKRCLPKIIGIGVLALAVTTLVSSCIKGCTAPDIEPTQPTETIVQETTIPKPEYYEATVTVKESYEAYGKLYEDVINPYVFQDIYSTDSFENYNSYIGRIDTTISELLGTYSYDISSYSTSQLENLEDLTGTLISAYSNQYYAEENARQQAEELRDDVGYSNSKYALYDRQVKDITDQQTRTKHNYWLSDSAFRNSC